MSATSGGFPPAIAVASTVGTLLPAEVKLTFTFGYFFSKPAMTAWNDFCSVDVQTPIIEILPETAVPLAPAPPATDAAAAAVAARQASVRAWKRYFLMQWLLSYQRFGR